MSPDLVNAIFEVLGGLFVVSNCVRLQRDKAVKGVNAGSTVLFTFWGIWNLWYYPHLGQWLSFLGGIVIVIGNTAWIALAWRYRARGA